MAGKTLNRRKQDLILPVSGGDQNLASRWPKSFQGLVRKSIRLSMSQQDLRELWYGIEEPKELKIFIVSFQVGVMSETWDRRAPVFPCWSGTVDVRRKWKTSCLFVVFLYFLFLSPFVL
ncbi:hypothetical protein RvY_15238 [Ramazzottius varieornatus]|uniref:Uncharacterized protein n=1 Tax=Ramazzottius varieornatus TaxID=947166 RepID=A0A1D1VU92_RAMVA|nr:hypothetical protein RvY_15238 [Ramazzottius varieornatus]